MSTEETIYGCSNCLVSRDRIDETHVAFQWLSHGEHVKVTLHGEEVPWVTECLTGKWIVQAVPNTEDNGGSVTLIETPACKCSDEDRGIILYRKVFGPYEVTRV